MIKTITSPVKIGKLELKNRVIMAPMQTNKGTIESFANDYHIKHYADRAEGISMMIIESTAVSPDGRLFPDDIGIFRDEHIEPLKQIVDAVHAKETKIFVQLSHGGRKSWPEVTDRLIGPSCIAYDEHYGEPNEMTDEDITQVIEDFRLASRRSLQAGFDGIELHAAHGFLLHEFLSPLSNRRTDKYGGSIENRVRLVREVLDAIRLEVGKDYPVIIRVSASEFDPEGLTPADIGNAMTYLESSLDAVHVSSGGLLPTTPLTTHEGYQVPYAAVIKQYVKLPIIAVGKIYTPDLANAILADQLADIIAIGRPLLEEPLFVKKMIAFRS
ncbi:NADH:flavin oxidoreductase [Shimazuella alba]|uniref:NADH:flavin oxidoreductase n=1 Tax=Shimazuella alba TaxID=2690964 RepID=A0A6I4W0Z4_9BACL|nr:NADH:flavin oxidoreductase [Shimazuella alba]MXQ55920.1 NADH:flavin oxidoreductase [Shimazuella alba]